MNISMKKKYHGFIYKKLSWRRCQSKIWYGGTVAWHTVNNVSQNIDSKDEAGLSYNCLPPKMLPTKDQSCYKARYFSERITVLVQASSDGSEKLVPHISGKLLKTNCFNFITKFLSHSKQMKVHRWPGHWKWVMKGCPHGCTILLFAYNCATNPSGMSFITNVKVVYYPPNAKSMLQPLDLGITQVYQPLVQEAPSTKPCAFSGLGTGHRNRSQSQASNTLHSSTLVTSHRVDNCESFHQCSCQWACQHRIWLTLQ
jgi:hypothetical protein